MHRSAITRLRTTSAAAISASILLATASPSRAQSADAEALFNDGVALMTANKLADACDAFEGSNRIEARAGTLLRLGECRQRNDQLASAWSAYRDALGRAKDPAKRRLATAKIKELEPRLSYLTVSVPDEAHIDGLVLARNGHEVDPAAWNRAIPVDGGSYAIAGRAPGHELWQTTVVVPNEHGKASVEVPKFKELAKLVPRAPEVIASHEAIEAPRVAPAAGFELTNRREVAIGLAGGAVVGLGAGIILGALARTKQHDAALLCPTVACADASAANAYIKEARSRSIGADVAFGASAALAISAGVLWLVGAPARKLEVAPAIAASQAGVTFFGATGRF